MELHSIAITAGQSVGKLPHAASVPRDALLQNARMRLELKEVILPAALLWLNEFQAELSALGTRRNHSDDVAPSQISVAFLSPLWCNAVKLSEEAK